MASQFIPVELSNIQRGKFVTDCEKAFSKLAKDFVAHTEKHEVSASAALNIGIKLSFEKSKMAYALVTDIAAKMPKDPSGVTTAFVAEDGEGQKTLFTQMAGTSKDNPRQERLQTQEGETIT